MHLYNKLHIAFEQETSNGRYSSILRRGWKCYMDQAVQKVEQLPGEIISGIVYDGQLFATTLDAEHFKYSNCTCLTEDVCEHKAALFFQFCRNQENGKVLAEQSYFRLLGLMKANEIQSSSGEDSFPQEIKDFLAPHTIFQYLEEQFGDEWKKCKHSFHPLSSTLTTMKALAKNCDDEVRKLHWIVSVLFVMGQGDRALRAVDSFSRYYHEMTFHRIAEPWIAQLNEWIVELSKEKLTERALNWLDACLQYIYERAIYIEKGTMDWDYVYYDISRLLAQDEEWKRLQRNKLQLAIKMTNSTHSEVSFLYAALAVIAIEENQDKLAIEYFEQCKFEKIQRLIYPTVERRMKAAQWDSAFLWMNTLFSQFHQQPTSRSLGPFLQLCRLGDQLQPDFENWSRYMIQLLPHSYSALSEHLLQRSKYMEWADLQLYTGMKIEDIKSTDLKEVMKNDSASLIPLYHISIDACIQSRNRQGYRLAAKQLKTLESLYRTIGNEEKWHQYISFLKNKYMRLRAFQEELLKGNLM